MAKSISPKPQPQDKAEQPMPVATKEDGKGGVSDGNGKLKYWHPKKLNPKHLVILQAHAAGLKNREICDVMGMSESRVSSIIHDPRAPRYIEQFCSNTADGMRDVIERIRLYSNEALTLVMDQLRDDSEDPNLRQRAAFSILDRAGYSKIEKKLVAHAEVSEKAAGLLAGALGEARRIGEAIEADYTIE